MSTLQLLLHLTKLMLSKRLGVRLDNVRAVALEFVGIGLGVAGPYALKLLVDGLSAGRMPPLYLIACVALFVGSWAGPSLISTVHLVYTTRVIDALARHISTEALATRLPTSTAGRDGDSGRTLGLLERLPYSLSLVVEGLIWRTGPILIQLIVSLAIIGGLIPFRYVVILAAVLIGYVVATWLGAVRHRVHANATNAAAAEVSQTLGDVLRNARRVVLNGALGRELRQIGTLYTAKRRETERMYWSLVTMSALQYGIVGLGLLLLLVMSGLDVGAGKMSAGDFVLLQAYAFRLAMPLSGFGYILAQAGVSIANIRDALGLIEGAPDAGQPTASPSGAATIALKGVTFSYGAGLSGISDVSAVIAPGDFVTIVGPNGSGKSTLAQLIAGVLTPSFGTIEINGQDLATVARADRHGLVLYVPQFIGLFNRSLMDNALYPPTTLAERDLAALLVDWRFYEAGREIDFAIQLGEQGERLSGGQIQKLELARLAGVRVPAVILDESTSSLDPRSEADVIATLRRKYGDATTLIMITHRPGLVRTADQVLFMQAGDLVGAGRHNELLARSEEYRQLWATTAAQDDIHA